MDECTLKFTRMYNNDHCIAIYATSNIKNLNILQIETVQF